MADDRVSVQLHASTNLDELRELTARRKRRGRTRAALQLLLVLVLGVLLGALFSIASNASPRTGTFLWNYKNRPVVGPLSGYEYVAVSPRAILIQSVADSLSLIGAHALVWLQPAIATTNGVPVSGPDFPWDTAALDLVTRYNAILKKVDGTPAVLWPGVYGSTMIDYRDSAFVDAYAQLILDKFRGRSAGVLWDYGCGDVSWANLGVDPAIWPAWRAGFRRLIQATRAGGLSIIQCDQYPEDLVPVSDGIRYEQAGMSLNPLGKVWKNVTAHPDKIAFVGVEELVPLKRRAFASLSLLTGSRFNWSDLRGDYGGGTKESYRDPEHFELDLGATAGALRNRGGGVWARNFKRGFVVLNMGTTPHAYYLTSTTKLVVQPGDGLVCQTRDTAGRYITRITNAGR